MTAPAKDQGEIGSHQEVLELFKPFEHFSKCLLDGYVIVDRLGKVVKANALFATMTGMKSKQLLKADSFDQIMSLSISGQKIRIQDLLKTDAPNRLDEVTGICAGKDGELNLIIGIFPFTSDSKTQGAFLLIRDVTAEASLQDKYKEKATKSITDSLTGLFNRSYFIEYLSNTVSGLESLPADSQQRTISMLMMDIDFFKKINDQHGHPAGDFILKETSTLLKGIFRKTDVVARYGGEEFLVILPSTDIKSAAVAAEKLRASIEQHAFVFEGKTIPVTISSGIASIDIGRESGEQAMARADAALYFSKKNGRNQVSIHAQGEIIPAKTAFSPTTKGAA